MERIKDLINRREKDFLVFVENKIVEQIQKFCQWRLHCDLLDLRSNVEQKIIHNEISPSVMEMVKTRAPLHYQYQFNRDPLETVYHYCWQGSGRRYESFEQVRMRDKGICFWVYITYKDFENEGFSEDLFKRLIKKYVSENIIRQKRGIQGYQYSVFDPYPISERITFVKKAVDIDFSQGCYVDVPREDWIYDCFSDDEISHVFEGAKKWVFEKICQGISSADI